LGILTNAINQLVGEVIGLGVDQLDAYFTGLIETGQQEKAAQEAARLDQELAQRGLMQDQLMSGQFNIPGMDLGGAPAMDPNSMQGKGVLSSLSTLPYIDPVINRSPVHSQLAVQRGTQFIQNNPLVLQREAAQKAAEERMGLVKTMTGDMFKQGDVGFQEGLGAFDNPRGFDLSRQDRIARKGELEAGKTTARQMAQEPFRDRSLQRSLQLKQTPGARATGGGGGPEGGPVNTLSPSTSSSIEKRFMKYGRYRTETGQNAMGNPIYELNPRGQRVREIAEEMYAGTKKPNWGAIERKAMAQEQKEFSAMGKMGQAEAQHPGNTAAKFGAYADSQPKSTPPAPPAKTPASQATTQQKIETLRSRGIPAETIREALKADGINPAEYGL